MTLGGSVLVLSEHPWRRLVAADAFRDEGAVVVEAATVRQAEGILRQLRFDVLAVDLYGLGIGIVQLVHDLGVDYPSTRVSVIGPPVDSDVLERFHSLHLAYYAIPCHEEQLVVSGARHHFENETGSVQRG